jgi:hypothetical protein
MAIIPGSAKVLNQYENVNTTYGGSKAMKAQSRWYTMDDVIETIEAEGTGISGSGTLNYVPKFTGSEEVGDSQIFDDGTNVGIGTDTPLAKLHIEGSFYSNQMDIFGEGSFLETLPNFIRLNVGDGAQAPSGLLLETAYGEIGMAVGGDTLGVKFDNNYGVWFRNDQNNRFGLSKGDNSLFAEGNIIQTGSVPSNVLTPTSWIRIYNYDTNTPCFIPVYE